MSGFQIPGLGHAKPDEKLPPLPTDQVVQSPSTVEVAPKDTDVEITDASAAASVPIDSAYSTQNAALDSIVPQQADDEVATTTAIEQPATAAAASDSMVIDQHGSPPDLTGALEAALGGLEGENAEQVLGQLQSRPEQPTNGTEQGAGGEHPEWEADSSPYESSSESSTSSDSSDEDSDNEGYQLLGIEETARLLMEAEGGGSDDEGDKAGKASGSGQVRTKNEVQEEVVPKPDVTITPEMKIEELGAVEHIVENIILVKAITPGEYQVLDTGSVLCNADRVVIGAVAETIGKVLQPMYTVYFTNNQEIQALNLEIGTKVFYPVDHASYVFTEPLKGLKGSDASNLHDEEVGDDEMEFSDDEKEAEYKRALKNKRKGKSARGGKEPHPLRQELGPDGELNYDDDDGPYKPLARPPGFGSGPVSQESEPSRPNFNRGRGRGDSRGRGQRGRGFNNNRGGGGGGGGRGRPADGYSLPPQGATATQQAFQPPPPPGWNPQGGNAPAMPNFPFQWPPQPQATNASAPFQPPPPPGWPGSATQAPNGGGVDPAAFAALVSQMYAQNGQQPPSWGGQQGR
jgi:H/ACA ribonucleoprotein complex non-core subunit NAF1